MKTESELKALGERKGWKARTLTKPQAVNMGSDEYEWHEKYNNEALNKALNQDSERAKNREATRAKFASSVWDGTTPATELSRLFYEEQDRWVRQHPAINWENYAENDGTLFAFADILREKHLTPAATNFDAVLPELFARRKVTFNLQKIGQPAVDPKRLSELTADLMRKRRVRDRVGERQAHEDALQAAIQELPTRVRTMGELTAKQIDLIFRPLPVSPQDQVAAQSADEYRRDHAEAFATGQKNPWAEIDFRKALATLAQNHPEYIANVANREKLENFLAEKELSRDLNGLQTAFGILRAEGKLTLSKTAVVSAGITTLTDFGGGKKNPGYPEWDKLEKASFRAYVRDLPSEEYSKTLRDDPAFKAAVEDMQK